MSSPLILHSDEYFMRKALAEAEDAGERGEVPIGAVVVHQNRVIARAANQVEMLKDATAHAEMVAITQAAAHLGNWRLSECTLYVTKEPCAMCAGAMVNAKLGKLVFGCDDPRSGAAGGALDITGFPGMLYKVEVSRGVLAEACLEVIQRFFKRRRAEGKTKKGEGIEEGQ